jgi:hypothetical protein
MFCISDISIFKKSQKIPYQKTNEDKSQMYIVTGPNIDIIIKLIKRIKSLFERKMGLTFGNKETVLELNGCRIEAYPSNT